MIVVIKGVFFVNVVVNVFNVFFVIVCCDLKIIEGLIVSVNYVLGLSGDCIEKMFFLKCSFKVGSCVLIVDDFLKGGGIVNGMISFLCEFDLELVGVVVFVDNV